MRHYHFWELRFPKDTVVECLWCRQVANLLDLRSGMPLPPPACPSTAWGGSEHVVVGHLYSPYENECVACGGRWSQGTIIPHGHCDQKVWEAMQTPHPYAPNHQTPAQVLTGINFVVAGNQIPPPPTTTGFCDFRLDPTYVYDWRCTRCGFLAEDYAEQISKRGYYPPRACLAAVPKGPGKRCSDCGADWCEYLDVYYGIDAAAARRCSKCRPRYERKAS